MFFVENITIPANTTVTAPYEQAIRIKKGVVHIVEIFFPDGCAGMVKLQINRKGSQIWPFTRGQYFTGNSETISFREFYEIETYPLYFMFKGWSPGTSYDHTIQVRIGILPKWTLIPIGAYEGLIQALRSIFIDKLRIPPEEMEGA